MTWAMNSLSRNSSVLYCSAVHACSKKVSSVAAVAKHTHTHREIQTTSMSVYAQGPWSRSSFVCVRVRVWDGWMGGWILTGLAIRARLRGRRGRGSHGCEVAGWHRGVASTLPPWNGSVVVRLCLGRRSACA